MNQGELFPEPVPDVRGAKTFALSGVYVTLDEADTRFAAALGVVRQRRAERQDRPNHRVSRGMTDLELHTVGARGEVAIARHYGLPLPALDLGATAGDVGGVEVKCTTAQTPRLYLRDRRPDVPGRPPEPERPVALVIDEGSRLKLAGWLWTYEVRVPEFDWGRPGRRYAVPARRLSHPDSLPIEAP